MITPSSPGDEPQTALLLTEAEWSKLGEICKVFEVVPLIAQMMPEHVELAHRIIQASEAS
jgi:hypothetical protein